MAEHPGTGRDGADGFPRNSDEILKILACDVKREVLYELGMPVAEVSRLAARVERDLPQVSKALTTLMRAGLVDVRHNKQFHACSLTERVVVRREASAIIMEITALNGDQVRVVRRTGRDDPSAPGNGHWPSVN